MSGLEVRVLGTAAVSVGPKSLRFGDDKRFQLLAHLACKSDWVSREQVAALFWPDTTTPNARKNLTPPDLALTPAGYAPAVPPGDAQVTAGRRLALQTCAACHGASLEGRYGPSLTGAKFTARWQGRSGAELRAFIAFSMPLGRAGTLDDAQTLALVAYILRANGLPGGPELTPEALEHLPVSGP